MLYWHINGDMYYISIQSSYTLQRRRIVVTKVLQSVFVENANQSSARQIYHSASSAAMDPQLEKRG